MNARSPLRLENEAWISFLVQMWLVTRQDALPWRPPAAWTLQHEGRARDLRGSTDVVGVGIDDRRCTLSILVEDGDDPDLEWIDVWDDPDGRARRSRHPSNTCGLAGVEPRSGPSVRPTAANVRGRRRRRM